MRDIAEILDHWQRGRSIQAISASLGLDRKTVRKYVGLAEQAGFSPGQRPGGGWGAWLDQQHPELNARGRRRPTVEQLDPLREEVRRGLEAGSPRPRPGDGSIKRGAPPCPSPPFDAM